MKKLIFITILIFLIIGASTAVYFTYQSQVVNPKLAEKVAFEYLQKFYPEDVNKNISLLGYNTLYDLDGNPRVYEFIFKNKEFESNNFQELERLVYKEKDMNKTNEEKRDRYHTDKTYTIVIGAIDTSDINIRHYRGLPSSIVKRPNLNDKLNSVYADKNLELGRVIFLNALDNPFEVREKNKLIEGNKVSSDSYLMNAGMLYMMSNVSTAELIKVSDLRNKIRKSENYKEENYKAMTDEIKQKLEEGHEAKSRHFKGKWEEYSKKYGIPLSVG